MLPVMPAHRAESATLELGGITPFSSVDFPGKLAAVLFCQGCPLRCPYCHNPHLQAFVPGAITWPQTLDFLESRRGLLDAVVFSGGEPLAQASLEPAMREVRALGFGIGLHTAGTHLARLRRVLPLCDWIGLDIKAPRQRYRQVCGRAAAKGSFSALALLRDAGVDFEIRTTLDPGILTPDDVLCLAQELAGLGMARWVLQDCRQQGGPPKARLPTENLDRLRQIIADVSYRSPP